MDVIINTLNKVDEVMFKKIDYRVYLVGAFIMLAISGSLIYEYATQEPTQNFTISLKDYIPSGESIMIEVQEGCDKDSKYGDCYQEKSTTSFCDSASIEYGSNYPPTCYETPESWIDEGKVYVGEKLEVKK
jgi:hypothetical protein